ncbi:MAG: hypothetical protein US30_C0003G0016 [Candidatus Moranbacteria bacterium GW2011_GWF2_36_839]|nr:MAG: hypothetical protein US27_C0004G0016 [Candidatus Moranbacteria bacterium GW2011_GWF1_36_78]KKQ17449.1 MAG: hypothetical protein US30_C0003G0016 [Candidatus Moranbacteria bacterium GW2011_GWF2_36_839]HAT73916.1 hypothetical protein [Candidatus Moranbacteria bacterium]HBY10558.1 hypothetical protein [Candidatus Moranbacteria bacterium]
MKSKKKICIVGLGRFGTLIASILKKDFEVSVMVSDAKKYFEKAEKLGIKIIDKEDLKIFDIVILCPPISKTEQIIKEIGPFLKEKSLLVDTCSVKTLPCQWMKKHAPKNVEILGTHPMFGPVTTKFNLEKQTWKLDGLQIVLCPLRINQKKLEKIRKFLKKLKLKVIETTPQEHDRQNAKTLALVHFLGRALVTSGVKEQEIFTPGYADLLKIIPHTASDNWQLFFDMNNFNPFSEKIRKDFLRSCHNLDFKIAFSKGKDDLESSRNIIDSVDEKVFELLKIRFGEVRKIGKTKKKIGKNVRDTKREERIIENKVRKFKMDKELVENIYKAIFNHSYKIQK